jgi:hypothetical protein
MFEYHDKGERESIIEAGSEGCNKLVEIIIGNRPTGPRQEN